jgi:hypothetical protein
MAALVQLDTGTSATLSETFQVNGVPSDLDSGVPTVTLTRPDGTAGPASGTVSHVGSAGSGTYSFVVAAQANPIWFDIAWVGTIGGQPQTLTSRVEWVGQPLFTIAAMRALKVAGGQPFAANAVPFFTDQQIMDARTATLDEFIRILGFSPVPRFQRETHDGDGSWQLRLGHRRAFKLLSVVVNGAVKDIAGYTLADSGILEATSNYVPSGWFTAGRGNVAVEYVAGWGQVQGDGARQAMLYAAADLNPSVFTMGTTVTTPDGVSITYEPSEMGRSGYVRHTGIRSVDRWLNRWSLAGSAVG